jgi:hypothetical protein
VKSLAEDALVIFSRAKGRFLSWRLYYVLHLGMNIDISENAIQSLF